MIEINTSLSKEELDYYLPYIEKIKEIEYTTPISMDQIMKVIEVASHNSIYGIFNSDELLYGVYGGDISDLKGDERIKKIECRMALNQMIKFWSFE